MPITTRASSTSTPSHLDTTPAGGVAYVAPGTYNFVVPNGVKAISVAAVGGGGGGLENEGGDAWAGRGGDFRWSNYIRTTPGETLTVTVGAGGAPGLIVTSTVTGESGEPSSLKRSTTNLLLAAGGGGGKSNSPGATAPVQNGTSTTINSPRIGGGTGGTTSTGRKVASGGGGAGGYLGNGGNGGAAATSGADGTAGAVNGGGGGGGSSVNTAGGVDQAGIGGAGGGIGIRGLVRAAFGAAGGVKANPAGARGSSASSYAAIGAGGGTTSDGALYGGGGGNGVYNYQGASNSTGTVGAGFGGDGALSIVWGHLRSWPENNAYKTTDTEIVPTPSPYLNFTFVASASFANTTDGSGTGTNAITIPSTAQAGDLAIMAYAALNVDSSTVPASVVPSGWTVIHNNTSVGGGEPDSIRIITAYRILTSGNPGSSLTVMNAGRESAAMTVFRPESAIGTLVISDVVSEATQASPTAQDIPAASKTSPFIAVASYFGDRFTTSNVTSAPLLTYVPSSGSTISMIGYKIVDEGDDSVDISVDKDDNDVNGLASFIIQATS